MGIYKKDFQDAVYDQTVGKVRPRLVVPLHWDSFFDPLSDKLQFPIVGDGPGGFDYLIGRLKKDGIKFGIMQGYQSVLLFGDSGLPGKKKGELTTEAQRHREDRVDQRSEIRDQRLPLVRPQSSEFRVLLFVLSSLCLCVSVVSSDLLSAASSA